MGSKEAAAGAVAEARAQESTGDAPGLLSAESLEALKSNVDDEEETEEEEGVDDSTNPCVHPPPLPLTTLSLTKELTGKDFAWCDDGKGKNGDFSLQKKGKTGGDFVGWNLKAWRQSGRHQLTVHDGKNGNEHVLNFNCDHLGFTVQGKVTRGYVVQQDMPGSGRPNCDQGGSVLNQLNDTYLDSLPPSEAFHGELAGKTFTWCTNGRAVAGKFTLNADGSVSSETAAAKKWQIVGRHEVILTSSASTAQERLVFNCDRTGYARVGSKERGFRSDLQVAKAASAAKAGEVLCGHGGYSPACDRCTDAEPAKCISSDCTWLNDQSPSCISMSAAGAPADSAAVSPDSAAQAPQEKDKEKDDEEEDDDEDSKAAGKSDDTSDASGQIDQKGNEPNAPAKPADQEDDKEDDASSETLKGAPLAVSSLVEPKSDAVESASPDDSKVSAGGNLQEPKVGTTETDSVGTVAQENAGNDAPKDDGPAVAAPPDTTAENQQQVDQPKAPVEDEEEEKEDER